GGPGPGARRACIQRGGGAAADRMAGRARRPRLAARAGRHGIRGRGRRPGAGRGFARGPLRRRAAGCGAAGRHRRPLAPAAAWPHAMQIWQQAGDAATADLWMPVIRAALVALGFPGERALDSVGYQVMGAFGELLGRYAALAPAAGPLDGRAAVRLLANAA